MGAAKEAMQARMLNTRILIISILTTHVALIPLANSESEKILTPNDSAKLECELIDLCKYIVYSFGLIEA